MNNWLWITRKITRSAGQNERAVQNKIAVDNRGYLALNRSYQLENTVGSKQPSWKDINVFEEILIVFIA